MVLLALLVACSGDKEECAGGIVAPTPAVVGELVTLDASGSEGLTATWDLGDGTVQTGWEVEHAWDAPGQYRVTLDIDGSPPDSSPPDSDSLVVTVVNPPLDQPPAASGLLVSDGSRLFAALPDFDQVAEGIGTDLFT